MAITTPSIQELRASAKELCRGERVPDTSTVEEWMAQADACAKHVMLDSTAATEQQDSQSPASSSSHAHGHAHAHEAWDLLMVEEKSTGLDLLPKNQQALGRAAMISRLRDDLSNLVHSVVVHPDICISPQVLTHYISIQATLERPSTLAQVIELARTKPIPRAKSSPPSYRPAQPNAIINSITPELAQQALQVALDARALVAAIDIINASYGTTAFRRAQVLRRGWLPATLMALVPAGAWTVASRLALFQTTIESGTATGLAFVGFLAYAGFTGTLGFVALSTANDQMERVTWASGVPLRERWLREDERAALDAVACAWGFGEVSRRGEEEGAEWDALREWCGAKGMVLDRVSLMQGME